ncbi:MAG: hypothetical protein SPG38_05050, partial [Desulfovibrio sp.]|uniref:hypothetical protein n=1 Tax=Desulfovibrio sp. TaxID=885 RepID=UPI002A91A526
KPFRGKGSPSPYSPARPKPFLLIGMAGPRRWLAGEDIEKQDARYSSSLPTREPDMTIAQKKTPRGVFFCA